MRYLKSWAIGVVCTMLICLTAFSVSAAGRDHGTVTHRGRCGAQASLAWTMYSDGTLVISGNGTMEYGDSDNWSQLPFRSLIIESGVNNIASYAFMDCTSLSSVSIADTVTRIESFAFCGCTGLRSITIPDSVTVIDSRAFYECRNLASVKMPADLQSVGGDVFTGTALFANYPGDIVYFENICFGHKDRSNPSRLSGTVSIKPGTEIIAGFAFCSCDKITDLVLPDSLRTIGQHAFKNCDGLKAVRLPNSLTTIEDAAFYGCDGLTGISIPDSVLRIEDDAFMECYRLSSVKMSANIQEMGYRVFEATAWPPAGSKGVIYAGPVCYSVYGPVQSVVIRQGTRVIASEGLAYNDELIEVTLPESIVSVGKRGFAACRKLKRVNFAGHAPAIAPNAFVGVTAEICYPRGDLTWTDDKFQNYGGDLTWLPAGSRAEKIVLNKTKLSIKVGSTFQMQASLEPADSKEEAITYRIGNSSIATVSSSGVVRAVAPGNTWLHAETAGGLHAQCLIQVPGKAVTSVTYPYTEKVIYVGRTGRFCPTVHPSDAANKTLSFRVGNPKIASVDRYGNLKGLQPGNTWLYATAHNGKQVRVLLRVRPYVPVTAVTYPYSSKTVKLGTTALIHPNVQPSNATDKTLRFSVGNTGVATVDAGGNIRGKAVGNTWLYATSGNGKQVKVLIRVLPAATHISLPAEKRISQGTTVSIGARLAPSNAYPDRLTYSVGNTNVATVDSRGNVRAVAPGNTWLTVRSAGGKTARCLIRVTGSYVPVASVSYPYPTKTVPVGTTGLFRPTVSPSNATNKTLTFSVGNTGIATVDARGNIRGKAVGNTWLYATANNGKQVRVLLKIVAK